MTNFIYDMPFINNYITEQIKQRCQEQGHVCHFWINEKIYDDLKFLDSQDKKDRAGEYSKRCHTPELVYQPVFGENPERTHIRCRPNDWSSAERCDFTNQEVADEFLKEIKCNE